MGSIKRFDLSRIIKAYQTQYFFETGTFRGDGVAYALQSPFEKVLSVEIIPEIADKAKARFCGIGKVEIIENDSEQALRSRMSDLAGNCVFWLDAHFPGADAGLKNYDENMLDSFRLPLKTEIEIIRRERNNFNDVLIIDDLRIYEDGPYQNGNVPMDALPASDRNIDFIYDNYRRSHVILRCYLDEGYIIVIPKLKYYTSLMKDFLKLRPKRRDFYLV